MKKLLLIVLFLCALTSLAYAGEKHTVTFDNQLTPQFVSLNVRDIAVFDYPIRVYYEPYQVNGTTAAYKFKVENQSEAIMLEDIYTAKDGKVYAKLAVFLGDSKYPYYLLLSQRDSAVLDFEFDEIKDITVQAVSVQEGKGATFLFIPADTSGKVAKPHVTRGGPAPPDITNGNTQTNDKLFGFLPKNTKVGYLLFAGVIIVILIFVNWRSIKRAALKAKRVGRKE